MDTKAVRERAAGPIVRGTTNFLTGTTNPPAPRPRWLRRGRFDLVEMADAIIALICFLVSNSTLANQNMLHGHQLYGGVLLLVAFVTSAPLVLRTRLPFTAWIASALSILGTAIILPPRSFGVVYLPTSVIVYLLCLYAVTVRCAPRIVVATAIVTVLTASFLDPGTAAGGLLLTAIPLLFGTVVRTRRSGKRQLVEQERRHYGERALLEERQRIARELHDVVAHHMSVIAIQAEAAPYKSADAPPELVESFGEIRASALTGLTELRRLLGVLRTGGTGTAPPPGLAGLDALLDSARSGGLSVTATITGDPVPLPEGVDLSAYRILQEALSNAMRHAPGSRADVRVAYRADDSLYLQVLNDAASAPVAGPGGGGHGIIGMRERAAMLGGTLFAGPCEGGFRVTAVLPVRPGDAGTEGAA
jgi:signal transduction histidine kinase